MLQDFASAKPHVSVALLGMARQGPAGLAKSTLNCLVLFWRVWHPTQILFSNESGAPPKRGAGRPSYFALGGAIVQEFRWHRIQGALNARHRTRSDIKWLYFAVEPKR